MLSEKVKRAIQDVLCGVGHRTYVADRMKYSELVELIPELDEKIKPWRFLFLYPPTLVFAEFEREGNNVKIKIHGPALTAEFVKGDA